MKHWILILVLLACISCTKRYTIESPIPGPQGEQGVSGSDGLDGTNGTDGVDGEDGTDCKVVQLSNGAYITCSDGSEATIFNGVDGSDSVAEVIDPCGDEAAFDEVLFRFADDTIYAVYADLNANKIHLTELPAGAYVTTDGTDCHFTIDTENQLSY